MFGIFGLGGQEILCLLFLAGGVAGFLILITFLRKGTTGRWKIRIKVDMQPKVTAPTAGLVVFKKNGKVATSKIKLNKKTKGSTVLAFSSRTVKQVDLVLINGGTKSNRGKTKFSAQIFR